MKLGVAGRATMGALLVAVACLLAGGGVLAGCGGGGSTGTSTGGGTATAGGSGGTTSTTTGVGGGGTGGSSCALADCSDGFSCTIDACGPTGTCTHTIGPNEGATACSPGQYCTLESGCIAAPACATTAQCEELWKNDACKTQVACDPVTSLCTFQPLDKDGDGHPPPVCGGDDCDDSTALVHPAVAQDLCDGLDNDCDGGMDEEPECAAANPLTACIDGSCQCKPENLCADFCVDRTSDPDNCGMCGVTCGFGDCVGGSCVCGPNETLCPDAGCQNLQTNPYYCGGCDHHCPPGATCAAGMCVCPAASPTLCGDVCVDLQSDLTHCGECSTKCDPIFDICVNGQCVDPNGSGGVGGGILPGSGGSGGIGGSP